MNSPLRRQPLVEQTAAHLREGIQAGRWAGPLPGVLQFADQLMVSKDIVREALKQLEQEGWIQDCGNGRRRQIVEERVGKPARKTLRIGMMLYEPLVEADGLGIRILLGIRHAIETLGHVCIFSNRSLTQLNENLSRISKVVKAAEADAWMVFGASREVMEWFIAQPFPVYAYGGRFQNLPMACSAVLLAPAIESAVNTLVDLGHRRIVMLVPTVYRKPTPIPSVERYLALLGERGITVSDYHLPHFEDTVEGFRKYLEGLFSISPPTAILLYEASYYVALVSFLARRGMQVPRDVSVICMTDEQVFRLHEPTIAHFRMPEKEHVVDMTRWVEEVAKGRPNKRQRIFHAVYVPGDTVGPAKR